MALLPLVALVALASSSQAQTPEATVEGFVSALNARDLVSAAKFVRDGKIGRFLDELVHPTSSQTKSVRWPEFRVTNMATTVNGEHALVTFRFSATKREPEKTDWLVLVKTGDSWVIDVPHSEGLAFIDDNGSDLHYMSYVLTNPPAYARAFDAARATACLSTIKQLATALLLLSLDEDDVVKLNASNWKARVAKYAKNDKLFTCPEDPAGTLSYSFNLRLSGKSVTSVLDPSRIVALYEGKDGQLNFRHQGRAAVAYLDGHARLVTREEAKSLVWKP